MTFYHTYGIQINEINRKEVSIIDSVIPKQKQMQLSAGEKKCLQIFKTFVQKSFLPHIKVTNGSLSQWNIFQTLISAPNISINQLQSFVDSLSSNSNAKNEKMTLSKKQQLQQISKELNNLNKNFGGDRYRNTVCAVTQDNYMNYRKEQPRQQLNKQQKPQNSSGIMCGLQRILRGLQQNQKVIQNMSGDSQNGVMKNNRPVFTQISYNSSANVAPTSTYNPQNCYQGPPGQGQGTSSIPNFYKPNY